MIVNNKKMHKDLYVLRTISNFEMDRSFLVDNLHDVYLVLFVSVLRSTNYIAFADFCQQIMEKNRLTLHFLPIIGHMDCSSIASFYRSRQCIRMKENESNRMNE